MRFVLDWSQEYLEKNMVCTVCTIKNFQFPYPMAYHAPCNPGGRLDIGRFVAPPVPGIPKPPVSVALSSCQVLSYTISTWWVIYELFLAALDRLRLSYEAFLNEKKGLDVSWFNVPPGGSGRTTTDFIAWPGKLRWRKDQNLWFWLGMKHFSDRTHNSHKPTTQQVVSIANSSESCTSPSGLGQWPW